MLGAEQTTITIRPQFLLAIDPRELAMKYAEKPQMRIAGWLGIGLAGAAVVLWFRR